MNLNFLENGIDSLQKGFANLVAYENLLFKNDPSSKKKRSYLLKDAILFIQHGIEILIKKIIQEHSEYLIFSQIDTNVKSAIRLKNQKNLKSVFETELKHKIHTVTFTEAIERLKIIPSVSVSANLEKRLLELETYRNIIMHSEPHFKEQDINSTFEGLSDELDNFFSENIDKYKTISGYSDLIKNKEKFKESLKEKGLILKAKALEIITAALKSARISIGSNEIKRISDLNTCTKFLDGVFTSELLFGTDLYNGYTSGKVTQIKRKSDGIFEMYMEDNMLYAEFKLRSIILHLPEMENNDSPIIFIESDKIEHKAGEFNNAEIFKNNDVSYTGYLKAKEGDEIIFDKDKISDLYNNGGYHETYNDYARFMTKGIFCFLNIQGLKYNRNYKSLVYRLATADGKEIEVALRQAIKRIKRTEQED